ncbi:MAG: DUF885 family protein, partial [bacterium]
MKGKEMNKIFVILIMVVVFNLVSCEQKPSADQRFEALAKNYIEELLKINPQWATSLGDHRYDHLLNDYSLAGIERNRRLHKAYLDSLAKIDVTQLNKVNKIDYKILQSNLRYTIFHLDTLREYEWNPLVYNIGGAIYGLIAREFAPLKERLLNVKKRLKAIPTVIVHAKKNLKNPPKIHTETAILQNQGNINMIRTKLNMFLEKVPEVKEEFVPV